MSDYKPKPKKYDLHGEVMFMDAARQEYRFHEYLFKMFSDVSFRLLCHKYGGTLGWSGWGNKGTDPEMLADPYITSSYCHSRGDSRSDVVARDQYRSLMAQGKDAGLWTFHSMSGKQKGVVSATDENIVRINPEAFKSLVCYYAHVGQFNIESLKVASQSPGWYHLESKSSYTDRMNAWLEDEENTGEYRLTVFGSHEEQELHIRKAKDARDPDMLCMLSFLSEYKLAEMNSRWYREDNDVETKANQLLPSIPRDLLDDKLFDKETICNIQKTVKEKIEEIKKLSQSIKGLRSTLKKLDDYGGYEKLLSDMGKDMAKTLPTLSMIWLSESDYIAKNIASAFVEGKIQINLPGIQAIKE